MTRYATPYGVYQIDPVPAQPQVAHCHGFFVLPQFRGRGNAVRLKLDQLRQLKEEHYDFATATVDETNLRMKSALVKTGWTYLTHFPNAKTGTVTELWGINVKEARP